MLMPTSSQTYPQKTLKQVYKGQGTRNEVRRAGRKKE
jgi:hypothetical protein